MRIQVKVTKLLGTPVFAVRGFDPQLKRIYGGMYSEKARLWYYPAFHPVYEIVLKDLKALGISAQFSDSALRVIKQLQAIKARIEAQELPEGFEFKTKPYAHQKEGLVHAIYNFRSALFYACGLGKTKIIIDWQRAINCYPLILCPRVVLHVWATEAERHGIEQEFRIVDGKSKKDKLGQIADAKSYRGVVMSYDTAKRYYEETINQVPYNSIVADESHCIKSHTSARTKTALELSKKAARRVIMSGTPSLGDPRDMYSQLRFLSPSFAREEFWKFTSMFCTTAPYNRRVVVGYKNLDLLQERVMLIALRKTKEECLDLPKRVELDLEVPLENSQRKLYNGLQKAKETEDLTQELIDIGAIHGAEGVVKVPNAAVLINKLLQVTCGFIYKHHDTEGACDGCEHLRNCVFEGIQPHTRKCKVHPQPLDPVPEFTKENAKKVLLRSKLQDILAEPANKVIIWCQFLPELDLVEETLRGLWNNRDHDEHLHEDVQEYHVRVDGSTVGKAKTLADRFNEDRNCRVYLGQVATGVGLTLNAANYMIYYSLPWKLGDYEQSKDRNHRVGQERDTVIYRLIGRSTADESIAHSLRMKRTVAQTITTAVMCPRCEHDVRCRIEGVNVFEEGCIYQRKVARHVTKARTL